MSHKDKYGIEYSDSQYTDSLLRHFSVLTAQFNGIYSKKNDIVLTVENFATDWNMENSSDIIVFRIETLLDFAVEQYGDVTFRKGYQSHCVSYSFKNITFSTYSATFVDTVAKYLIERFDNTTSKEVKKFG